MSSTVGYLGRMSLADKDSNGRKQLQQADPYTFCGSATFPIIGEASLRLRVA